MTSQRNLLGPGFRLLEGLALLLYATVLSLMLPFHESWGDEVTAWLLGRNSSLRLLFGHLLRREGSPGLWHLLLWCLARMHLSFAAVHWICLVIAIGGVYVLLRWCSLPRPIKLLLPFGFYLAYQYAVIARSYVLFPLLVFSATALLSSSRCRLVPLAVVLGLLANSCAHGAVYSMLIAGLLSWSGWRNVSLFPVTSACRCSGSRVWLAATVLGVFWVAALATAIPVQLQALHNLQTESPDSRKPQGQQPGATAGVTQPTVVPALPPAALSLEPAAVREEPVSMSALDRRVWRLTHASANATHRETVRARLLYASVVLLSLLTFPVSISNALAVFFLASVLVFLWQRKALALLLPYVGLVLLCMATQVKEHHTGLLWIALIAVLWSGWNLPVRRGNAYALATDRCVLASLLLVSLLQVSWTVESGLHDWRRPYTGDVAAANFLRRLPKATSVVAARGAVGTGPPLYRDHFYRNTNPDVLQEQPQLGPMLLQHPGVVVVGDLLVGNQHLHNQWFPLKRVGASELSPADLYDLAHAGYRETHRFCGESFMRTGYSHELCQYIYEPGLKPLDKAEQE